MTGGRFAQVPLELLSDSRCCDGAVRLWAILSGAYADYSTGEAFPSRNTLAGILGVSVRTVVRYVNQLEQAGWLTVEHRKAANGDWTSNLYKLPQLSTGVVTPVSPPSDTGVTRVVTQMAHKRYPTNDTNRPTPRYPQDLVQRTLSMLNDERQQQRKRRR